MKRRLAALLCALALSLSLAGCWSSDVSDEGNDFWEEPPEQEADNSPLTPITSFALPYLQGVTLDPLTCPDGMQQVLGALLYDCLLYTSSFSTAMVSMAIMLPSKNFSSTQAVSMLNSQEINLSIRNLHFAGC